MKAKLFWALDFTASVVGGAVVLWLVFASVASFVLWSFTAWPAAIPFRVFLLVSTAIEVWHRAKKAKGE